MKKGNRMIRFISAALALVVLSCDVVNIDPTHLLDKKNAFKDLEDVDGHLTGTYSSLQSGNYYGSSYGVLADMASDDLAENVESLGNFRTVVDWTYVANDGIVAGAWLQPYSVIKDVNLILENVEKFEEQAEGQRARIKGQALALRALAHFDLLRYFGQSYDRNSTLLGIPVKIADEVTLPSRNTVVQVYDQIYADLEEARTLLNGTLDTDINSAAARTKIDAAVVEAIQARVALYAKDYSTAIASATSVIEDFGFALASKAAFPTIWSDDLLADEVIWAIAYRPGEGQPGGNVFFSVSNRLSFKPSQAILGLYDQNNDVRYDAYFSDELTDLERDGQIVPIKYLGRSGSTDGNVNFKVFRLAEMYLIRAEAYANSTEDGLAMDDLNTLRDARIVDYVDENLTGATLKAAIADERRRELFIEGHRWFDLRRAGLSITRGADCKAPATRCELPASSHRWVWPIPQSEIAVNPNLADQQNPNY
jgi:hypothetical protein